MQRTDYDLDGLVGIRLLDASAMDVAAVNRQLGPIQRPLARDPDIVVRFVDRVPETGSLCYLGLEDVGFTEDAFWVLRGRSGAPVRVKIPIERIGAGCEILCERGSGGVPFLIPIVNLTALGNGAVPLHASAFLWQGRGVVVAGWSKGGKTETLLAFMARGATYIGDEWVYLHADGTRVVGIPEPMHVWDWHLRDLPGYRGRVARRERLRLGLFRLAATAGSRSRQRRTALGVVQSMLSERLFVRLTPGKLFGTTGPVAAVPETVVFAVSTESPAVWVEPIDPREVASRMVFSLSHERLRFMACYLKYRFAFPERRNALIDSAEEREREMLAGALAGKDAYALYHPYPVRLPALFEALEPRLGSAPRLASPAAESGVTACLS